LNNAGGNFPTKEAAIQALKEGDKNR